VTIFVGVDPASTRLDAVVMYPDGRYVLHKRTMPKDIVRRCIEAQRWIEDIVKTCLREDEVAVGVEEPLVASRFGGRAGANSALPTAKVHGALLAGAARSGAETLPINNKTWKRTIVGNGNSGKPAVNLWVKRHWPKLWIECKGRQDTCDAACIALEVKRVLRVRGKKKRLLRRGKV
jgi:Holliday junction resolvasome RuvABC endonuclease subunit